MLRSGGDRSAHRQLRHVRHESRCAASRTLDFCIVLLGCESLLILSLTDQMPYAPLQQLLLQPGAFPLWNSDYASVSSTSFEVCTALHANFTTKINVTFPAGAVFSAPLILAANATDTETLLGWQVCVEAWRWVRTSWREGFICFAL
jgi:hypothetical protein